MSKEFKANQNQKLDNQELNYGQTNFQQGGIIVATNNGKNHGNICSAIKKIIEENAIYPF